MKENATITHGYRELSVTQQKLLRFLKRQPNMQLMAGGYGRVPWLSSARALVRRKILIEYRTSTFAPSNHNAQIWKDVP